MSKFAKGLIGLATAIVVVLLIGALGVFAASPTATPPASAGAGTPNAAAQGYYSQFISKLASALGKSEADVKAAVATAEKGIVADALQAGKITQQQADAADQRIDQGGFGLRGFQGNFRGHFGKGNFGPGRFGRGGKPNGGVALGQQNLMKAAADYLGLSQQDLMAELRQGKSLADVVSEKTANGKTVDGLKAAMTASVKSALDQAVTSGKLTQDRETTALNNLSSRLDNLINRKFQAPRGRAPKNNAPGKPQS